MATDIASVLARLPPKERYIFENLLKEKEKKDSQQRFDLDTILFDKQLEVLLSKEKKKVLVCSRRAGKSFCIAAYLIHVCMSTPKSRCLYVGLTKGAARTVIWDILTSLIEKYELPCKPNNHLLTIEFSNKSRIIIEGAKDSVACERMRGSHYHLAVLDEAQGFPTMFALNLVSEVIQPSLEDDNGTLVIAGTPDPLSTSVLFRAWQGEAPLSGFQKFHWNSTQNSKFPRFVNGISTPETYLQELCDKTGYKMTDPGFMREYLGLFTKDADSLCYGFDPDRDVISELPVLQDWQYVISCDSGFIDSDAIVVTAFSTSHDTAYAIDAYTNDKQDVTAFMEKISEFRDKYPSAKVIMDPGGGGVKLVSELNNRYKISAKVAQKYSPKSVGAGIVASEFRLKKLKVLDTPDTEELQLQLSSITWHTRVNRSGIVERYIPDGKQVKGQGNNLIGDDLVDAFLYSIKYLKTYNYRKGADPLTPEERINKVVEDHYKSLSERFRQKQEEAMYGKVDDSWF